MDSEPKRDFLRQIIDDDLRAGRYREVVTRFPPEPNGYLHIGHAKSVLLNYGLAKEYGGRFHLRFDDTNPLKEEAEYEEAIIRDVRWLGADWGEHLYHASDYFERFYAYAEELIRKGLAYVCSQSLEEMRASRGTVTEPGTPSPDRDRPISENLELFRRMRAGDFADGELTLRAKIDMASPNMKLRDPPLYRIRHARHHRTGDSWCIYPMYDFAHCLSDSIEGITHSICTLEFENNRALYDWILDNLDVPQPRPHQYEFARLELEYTITSKRKLLQLVEEGHVAGWDDPRMMTIAGLRRRGVTPEAIRKFCEDIGVAKTNSTVEMERLDHWIREDLNHRAPRVMAVLDPLEVVIVNWPGGTQWLDAPLWPHDIPKEGSRKLPIGGRLFIEREDFAEAPPPGFRRLSPGAEVRLRHAFVIRCEKVVKDSSGRVVRLECSYDPETTGGRSPAGRKVKGVLHWVSAEHAADAEVRLYDRLFTHPHPAADPERDFRDFLNPDSLRVVQAKVEPFLKGALAEQRFQFERIGYFFVDPVDSEEGRPVFNRIIGLRDTWSRQQTGAAEALERRRAEKARRKAQQRAAGTATTARPLSEAARALADAHGLAPHEAQVLAEEPELRRLFEEAVHAGAGTRAAASKLVNEVLALVREQGTPPAFDGKALAKYLALLDAGVAAGSGAKRLLETLTRTGGDPEALVDELGVRRIEDAGALAGVVDAVLAEHPEEVARYRGGKRALIGFFVGQVMKATKGAADPKAVRRLLEQRLDGSE
ncbi:MAG: glutamine--tRNA ligase/YqeY domain fusion protein [Deltaproteobacteria bacterium]|nr:MAG: glutamine--tRNA ligase/YqeY domain fusion protein [Deltaproteobacteria bacterium]